MEAVLRADAAADAVDRARGDDASHPRRRAAGGGLPASPTPSPTLSPAVALADLTDHEALTLPELPRQHSFLPASPAPEEEGGADDAASASTATMCLSFGGGAFTHGIHHIHVNTSYRPLVVSHQQHHHLLLLHQSEEGRGVALREADAAMRGGAAEVL